MAIRVGLWDCSTCGHKGVSGPETKCPNCGAPRGKHTQFYLPEDAVEINDETQLKQANAGANWVCDFCGADNQAIDSKCFSCGNDLSNADFTRQEKLILDNPKPIEVEQPKSSVSTRKKGYIAFGVIAASMVALFLMFRTRETDVTITSHSWTRTIETEKFVPVIEEDWNIPQGGKLKNSFRAIHHYDKVLDGYESKTREVEYQAGTRRVKVGTRDKGNGYFEDVYENEPVYKTRTERYEEPIYRSVPVYQTKYSYEIWKWIHDQDFVTSGKDQLPVWHSGVPPNTDKHRESKRTENYVIHFKDDRRNEFEEATDFDYWNGTKPNQKIKAERNLFQTRLKEAHE